MNEKLGCSVGVARPSHTFNTHDTGSSAPRTSRSAQPHRRLLYRLVGRVGLLGFVAGLLPLFGPMPNVAAQTNGRSAFGHVTDGAFTVFPDGSREWSDV